MRRIYRTLNIILLYACLMMIGLVIALLLCLVSISAFLAHLKDTKLTPGPRSCLSWGSFKITSASELSYNGVKGGFQYLQMDKSANGQKCYHLLHLSQ